jgi:hypothetical protein
MRHRAALLIATFLSLAAPGAASAPQQPLDANGIIGRMIAENASLQTYRARVHVAVHMLTFPYLSPHLDGTSYYKRPGGYAVIFDSVPFYMKGFSKLFDNMGDAGSWERDQNVYLVGTQAMNSRRYYVLRMTKKIYSDILDHADAYVDTRNFQLVKMEWHYRSGGSIVMTEDYRRRDGFSLPASQHAYIDIPHIRAVGDATYGQYQVNVPVSQAVFTKS